MSTALPASVTWTPLTTGPHAGKTPPEVLLQDPDYMLDGLDSGAFEGTLLEQARELCRRAARIRPCRDALSEVTVLYHLNACCPSLLSGISVVERSDPRLEQYREVSAAESAFLDLGLARRLAPTDRTATRGLVQRVLFTHFDDPSAKLTRRQAEDFFADPHCIAGEE